MKFVYDNKLYNTWNMKNLCFYCITYKSLLYGERDIWYNLYKTKTNDFFEISLGGNVKKVDEDTVKNILINCKKIKTYEKLFGKLERG